MDLLWQLRFREKFDNLYICSVNKVLELRCSFNQQYSFRVTVRLTCNQVGEYVKQLQMAH